MHHKRKRPKTCVRRNANPPFPRGAPHWWDVVFHTRPKRRLAARVLRSILGGADPDGAVWPVSGHKPHNYYW